LNLSRPSDPHERVFENVNSVTSNLVFEDWASVLPDILVINKCRGITSQFGESGKSVCVYYFYRVSTNQKPLFLDSLEHEYNRFAMAGGFRKKISLLLNASSIVVKIQLSNMCIQDAPNFKSCISQSRPPIPDQVIPIDKFLTILARLRELSANPD